MAKEQNGNFEAQLFKAADKLRKNIDAAEYKNVALGLIFLKYISESFQSLSLLSLPKNIACFRIDS